MYMPIAAQKSKNKKVDILSFFGYDQREKIDDRQLAEMLNMSSDEAPCLAPRKPRRHIASQKGITALALPEYDPGGLDSFTGVADGSFYYKGKRVDNIALSKGEKSIVDFGGNICIFPDKVYYRYLPDPEDGQIKSELRPMGKSMTVINASFYSYYDEISGRYRARISRDASARFDLFFKPGDSLVISGCSKTQNNTRVIDSKKDTVSDESIVSAIVKEAGISDLDLLLYNKKGGYAFFENGHESAEVKIEAYIPDIACACVHNNRLFGASESGEYIFASKLGDCFNFSSFRGLADDSWFAEIGTPGAFTGIVSYRTSVVAFKRDYIHHVYGDSPTNFSVPKQTLSGALDGKSVAEVGGVLYYMAADGFYEYTGGEPERISRPIKTLFASCKSGTDGRRYYACAADKSGKTSLLVYDPDMGVWHREDDTKFVDFVRLGERLYGATETDMYLLGDEEADEIIRWCVVSKKFTLDDFDFKSVNAVYIRLESESDTKVTVSFAADDEDFTARGEIKGEKGFSVHRIPIRLKKCDSFRIMLEGEGKAVVHDIEMITYTGGKTNVEDIR